MGRVNDMSKKSVLFDTFLGSVHGLGHIPVRTHMALDSGKDVFEELLKTFDECRRPNWDGYGAQSVREGPTI